MRYLFLLWGDEAAERAVGQTAMQRIIEEHGEFTQRMRDTGRYLTGAGLDAGSAGRIVRRNPDGDDLITDGPFTESKEQLGGLYILECADMAEALRIAKEVPESPGLVVEVRPVPH